MVSLVFCLCIFLFPATSWALPPANYTLNAYLDTYYAYDFNGLPSRTRDYTSQATNDSEYNINLMHLDAVLRDPEWRGRFAVQYGDSVERNYAREPDQFVRYLQEGYVGRKLAEDLWLDVGVYFSHLGYESWISRENPTYLRSLLEDFSPYYQTGARLSWTPWRDLKTELHLIRGWQNVSDDKPLALGTSVQYNALEDERLTLGHSFYVGDEEDSRNGTRVYNFFRVGTKLLEKLTATASYGMGFQDGVSETRSWRGWSVITQYDWAEMFSTTFRVERFDDPTNVVAQTRQGLGFEAIGLSFTADVKLGSQLMLRNEFRTLSSDKPIFSKGSGDSQISRVWVISLSIGL